jgi:hypothetical protein
MASTPLYAKVAILILYGTRLLLLGIGIGSYRAVSDGAGSIETYLFFIQQIFEVDQYLLVL